jgi:F-type H+-transporting ATPase subunit b
MDAVASTLGLNWSSFIWQLVNFLVLLFLLRLVLYKPVVKLLDDRARRVRDSLQQAEEVRRKAEQAEADRQALLAETRQQAMEIRNRADADAKRIIAEAEGRAQEQANRILAQAESSIKASQAQMLAEVRQTIGDLVVAGVERVTRGALDGQAQRSLVQQFLSSDATDGAAGAPQRSPGTAGDRAGPPRG